MSKTKVLGGAVAVAIGIIGMDYLVPLLAPLDYVAVTTPWVFFGIPILLAGFGYFLATWRINDEQDRRKRWLGYGVRLLLLCLLCAIGFYVPAAYRERHVEFIRLPDAMQGGDQALGIEQALGFRVGVQSNSKGRSFFFKREPGASEKVREWLRGHGGQANTP